MGDLRFAKSRSVVFQCEAILLFVDAETAKAVGVGEFAQALKLFEGGRRLELVGDFEKCHGENYTSGEWRVGTDRKWKIEIGKWAEMSEASRG